jgi:hypothetical protein
LDINLALEKRPLSKSVRLEGGEIRYAIFVYPRSIKFAGPLATAPDKKAGKTGQYSGAGVSVWIIRIISRIVIPGIVAGLPIRKKAIDIISGIIRDKSSDKSRGVLAQILKLIPPVRRLTFIISQAKMRRIVVIRIFKRPIGDRKSSWRSSPVPQTATNRE